MVWIYRSLCSHSPIIVGHFCHSRFWLLEKKKKKPSMNNQGSQGQGRFLCIHRFHFFGRNGRNARLPISKCYAILHPTSNVWEIQFLCILSSNQCYHFSQQWSHWVCNILLRSSFAFPLWQCYCTFFNVLICHLLSWNICPHFLPFLSEFFVNSRYKFFFRQVNCRFFSQSVACLFNLLTGVCLFVCRAIVFNCD